MVLSLEFKGKKKKKPSVLLLVFWGVEERRSYHRATNLLENSRLEPAISCDGEPVPDRVLLDIMLLEFILPGSPKTDLAVVDKGSIGEFVAEGELERFWLAECEE